MKLIALLIEGHRIINCITINVMKLIVLLIEGHRIISYITINVNPP